MVSSTVPAHYVHTITARRRLSQIKMDFVYQVRNRLRSEDPLAPTTILDFKTSLDHWFENLRLAMQPKNIVSPSRLEVQSVTHHSFQPIKLRNVVLNSTASLSSCSSEVESP